MNFLDLHISDNSIVMDLVKWAHESFIFVHEVAKIAAVEHEQGIALHEGTYWKAVALTLICWRLDHCIEFLRYIKNDTPTQLFIEQLQDFDMAWLSDETKVSLFEIRRPAFTSTRTGSETWPGAQLRLP